MLPIYNQFIQFMRSGGDNVDLEEGYYWYDRGFIKFFSITGEIIIWGSLTVDDDLKPHVKPRYLKIRYTRETWNDTALRMSKNLKKLEDESIKVIKEFNQKFNNHCKYVLSSEGKDSQVTFHLAQKVIPGIKKLFNNTTLDVPSTYKFVKSDPDVEAIITPKEGFYSYQKRRNLVPNRYIRFCCSVYKEGALKDYMDKDTNCLFFLGMRKLESAKRANYEYGWRNPVWGNRPWQGVLPILNWSDLDVWLYIIKNNIPFPMNYKLGYSRLGCAVACPYSSKLSWALDEYWLPTMRKRWMDIIERDFIDNNKWLNMNCTLAEYKLCWNSVPPRSEPNDEVIDEFCRYTGINRTEAVKFFSKKCPSCGKSVNNRNSIAMNLKFNGRSTDKFFCKKCFLKEYKMTEEEYNRYIETFKSQGCQLF